MTPSPESLRDLYATLNDTVLLSVAAERHTLTPEAQAVLLQELYQRGLNLPNIALQHELAGIESPRWVTIDRFRDLSSALVARSALEAAEIDCFLRDENTVRLDWQISNFIGGMRLQVRELDEEAARLTLQQLLPGETSNEEASALEPEEHCPFCGSADVHRFERGIGLRAAALWLFALPLPRGERFWRCANCGREFSERDLALVPEH